MNIKQKFGLRIRQLRMQHKFSQENLAHVAGIDRTYIQSIEKGERNVSIEIIEKLATALNLKIELLLKDL